LCAECWQKLTFITAPHCHKCGLPQEFNAAESQCASCPHHRQPFTYGRSAMLYDETSKKLLLSYKHQDATHLTPMLANWLWQASAEILPQIDVVVPVPLFWQRLFWRRYNQAALLAEALAKRADKFYHPQILHRTRAAQQQSTLSRAKRLKNLTNAFAVAPNKCPLIAGKHVLVVDDVWTTGATLNACGDALRKAGASQVSFVSVGRTLAPQD
jgi:ComF family protein